MINLSELTIQLKEIVTKMNVHICEKHREKERKRLSLYQEQKATNCLLFETFGHHVEE